MTKRMDLPKPHMGMLTSYQDWCELYPPCELGIGEISRSHAIQDQIADAAVRSPHLFDWPSVCVEVALAHQLREQYDQLLRLNGYL